jgi:hypothetical protein
MFTLNTNSLRSVLLQPLSLCRCCLALLSEPNKVTSSAGITVRAEDAANADKLKKKSKKKLKKANNKLRLLFLYYSNVCSYYAFKSYYLYSSSTNYIFFTRSCFLKPTNKGVKLIALHSVK